MIYRYVEKPDNIELCVNITKDGLFHFYVGGIDSCSIDVPREVATELARKILNETAND